MSYAESFRHRISNAPLAGVTIRPAEYLKIILSRRHLERCHDVAADVVGVLDVDTGERFVVSRGLLVRSLAERCA
jgi:hypothetical protein